MSSRSVLVVDDERPVLDALRRLLERNGYTVLTASSGEAALETIRQQFVQLVLSDKDMPGMSGIELLEQVRERNPRIARVMLTGRADLESTLEAINRGEVFRFIEKPFTNEQLLGALRAAFEVIELEAENRRLHEEVARERERAETLLLQTLPVEIAARLKEGEKRIADRFEQATVLFSDLVGFTPLAARMPAGDVVSLLNEVFTAFDQLAGPLGVEKIKTIGDGYLAAAGLPSPNPQHARAVADFALGMLGALAQVSARTGVPLQMRIGIHTGPVVAGVIGLTRFSYDLWGDTVNVASRMEVHGEAGRIHVTDAVLQALGADYELETRGVIELKGRGPMRTHFLKGKRS